MSVPKLTPQDQALLDFANRPIVSITEETVCEVLSPLMTLFSRLFSASSGTGEEREAKLKKANEEYLKKLYFGNPEERGVTAEGLRLLRTNIESALNEGIGRTELPYWVRQEIENRIRRCPMTFDFDTGRFLPDFSFYDIDRRDEKRKDSIKKAQEIAKKLGLTWDRMGTPKRNTILQLLRGPEPEFDLSVLIAPAIAEFLFRHRDRLGHCGHPKCGRFFVAKRKVERKFCDEHTHSGATARYREKNREALRKKDRERFKKSRTPLVRRK